MSKWGLEVFEKEAKINTKGGGKLKGRAGKS